jgi:hypothetical protein
MLNFVYDGLPSSFERAAPATLRASCSSDLLRYMSFMMRLTTSASGRNRSRLPQPGSIAEKSSCAHHASSAPLASRYMPMWRVRVSAACHVTFCHQPGNHFCLVSHLRASLQGGNLSSEAWSGVRQLILLRTKRKAAEAALNSFMLAGGGGESEQIRQEPAPVSTLVRNRFVDVIGQQVRRRPGPCPVFMLFLKNNVFDCRSFTPTTR